MEYKEFLKQIPNIFEDLSLEQKIERLNEIRNEIHKISPFKKEPVDFVRWVPSDLVTANDYNPNVVAPPEMRLLEHSIKEDGYTQPIVSWENKNEYEVIDGFHRNRVGKESLFVSQKIHGYLPIVAINKEKTEKGCRIASTIRHNRARGKHQIVGMSDIVVELKNRNWTDEKIALHLGLDKDEILRLCQITGLASLFSDRSFSKSWDIEDSETDFEPITEEFDLEEDEQYRTVNTNDESRVFHTYDKWECYKAGFYKTTMPGMTRKQCEEAYAEFLSDEKRFREALEVVITEWQHSCEHYLTNNSMNRIAYLGQAAMCQATGIPSVFRSGFNLLSNEQQEKSNKIALEYLNRWLVEHNRPPVEMEVALSGKQMELY